MTAAAQQQPSVRANPGRGPSCLPRRGTRSVHGDSTDGPPTEPRGPQLLAGARLCKPIGKGPSSTVWDAVRASGEQVIVQIVTTDAPDEAVEHFRAAAEQLVTIQATTPIEGVWRAHAATPDGRACSGEQCSMGSIIDLSALGWALPRKLRLFEGVCRALAELHDRGMRCGYLWPGVVLLDDDFSPVLNPLGPAAGGPDLEPAAFEHRTRYWAPEVQHRREVDVAADLYTLGQLLHFLLTDEHPKPTHDRIPRLDSLADQPTGLVRIVRKATCAAPQHRYRSVEALLADLAHHDQCELVGLAHPGLRECVCSARQQDQPLPRRQWRSGIQLKEQAPPSWLERQPRSVTAVDSPTACPGAVASRPPGRRVRPASPGASQPSRALSAPSGAPGARSAAGALSQLTCACSLGPRRRMALGLAGAGLLLLGCSAATVVGSLAGLGPVWTGSALLGGTMLAALVPSSVVEALYARALLAVALGALVGSLDPVGTLASQADDRALRSGSPARAATRLRTLLAAGRGDFAGSRLRGADLSGLDLSNTVLEGSTLRDSRLEGTDLAGAVLSDADLSGARLDGADLSYASLEGAVLQGVRLLSTTGLDTALCDDATVLPEHWRCEQGHLVPADAPAAPLDD